MQVAPRSHVDLLVDLLPLKPGIQRLCGIKVVDLDSFQHTEYDDIGEVLVFKPIEPQGEGGSTVANASTAGGPAPPAPPSAPPTLVRPPATPPKSAT